MNKEENKKVRSYRKKEMDDQPQVGFHRDLPQMCPKYLTKNKLW